MAKRNEKKNVLSFKVNEHTIFACVCLGRDSDVY